MHGQAVSLASIVSVGNSILSIMPFVSKPLSPMVQPTYPPACRNPVLSATPADGTKTNQKGITVRGRPLPQDTT